jgi:hypothetical protein
MVMGEGAEASNCVHGQFWKALMRLLRRSTVFLIDENDAGFYPRSPNGGAPAATTRDHLNVRGFGPVNLDAAVHANTFLYILSHSGEGSQWPGTHSN